MAELGVPCGLGSFWNRCARLLAKEIVESPDPEGRRGGPLGGAIVLPSCGTDTEGWSRLLGGPALGLRSALDRRQRNPLFEGELSGGRVVSGDGAVHDEARSLAQNIGRGAASAPDVIRELRQMNDRQSHLTADGADPSGRVVVFHADAWKRLDSFHSFRLRLQSSIANRQTVAVPVSYSTWGCHSVHGS